MEKIIKIREANKVVKKSFDSIHEAKAYIIDNNLHAANKKRPIQIKETTVVYHDVETEFPDLSIKAKESLIKTLLNNVDDIYSDMLFIPAALHCKYRPRQSNKYTDIIYDIISKHFNVSDEDMKKYFFYYSWHDKCVKAPFADLFLDKKFLDNILREIVTRLIKESDINEMEFKFVQTNYVFCNNINILVGGKRFQIRLDDIRFGEGQVTGRNVSVIKVSDLTDAKYKEFFKKTKYYK